MADLVYSTRETIAVWPWLVKKFTAVQEASAGGTLPHAEGRAPDVCLPVMSSANPTASEVSVRSTDATNVTLDCEGNSSAITFTLYCVWFSQSSGGLTDVA